MKTNIKTLVKTAAFVGAMALATPALAKPMTLTVRMARYYGNYAYVAVYILGPKGRYVSTVYAAGSRSRYFEHLSRWYRLLKRSHRGVDGSTGASVGAGQTFTARFTLPDKILGKGYTLRVATAVEGQYYVDKDAVVPLKSASNGKAISGTHYVDQVTLNY